MNKTLQSLNYHKTTECTESRWRNIIQIKTAKSTNSTRIKYVYLKATETTRLVTEECVYNIARLVGKLGTEILSFFQRLPRKSTIGSCPLRKRICRLLLSSVPDGQ